MAAYDYERNWAFSFDNSYTPASAADKTRRQLWALGAMLCGNSTIGGFAQGLWTVAGSSNGVAAGMDAVDRLNLTGAGAFTLGDWVAAAEGSAHSWYVLQSPTMNGSTWYILISFNGANTAPFFFAKTAFTGGSVTAVPTSPDSFQVYQGGQQTWNDGSTTASRCNMCLSSTGDFIFFHIKAGTGIAEMGMMCVAPVGCDPRDLWPMYVSKSHSAGSAFNVDYQSGSGNALAARNAIGTGGYCKLAAVSRPVQTMSTTNGPDLLTGKYLAQPCFVISYTNSTTWHHRGRLPDILLGGLDNSAQGVNQNLTINNPVGGAIRAINVTGMWIPANAVPSLA